MRGDGVVKDTAHGDLLFHDGQKGEEEQKGGQQDGDNSGGDVARGPADEGKDGAVVPREEKNAEDERCLQDKLGKHGKEQVVSRARGEQGGHEHELPDGRDGREEEADLTGRGFHFCLLLLGLLRAVGRSFMERRLYLRKESRRSCGMSGEKGAASGTPKFSVETR